MRAIWRNTLIYSSMNASMITTTQSIQKAFVICFNYVTLTLSLCPLNNFLSECCCLSVMLLEIAHKLYQAIYNMIQMYRTRLDLLLEIIAYSLLWLNQNLFLVLPAMVLVGMYRRNWRIEWILITIISILKNRPMNWHYQCKIRCN